MKTPLCEMCLQTRDLCSGCQHKLDTGKLTPLEVDFSRILYKMREKLALEDVTFTRAIDCGNILYVFTASTPGLLIGKRGRTISALIKERGEHIRIVQENPDQKPDVHRLVEEVLHPVKPSHINSVYSGGSEVTKIVVPRALSHKLPSKPDKLQGLFERLLERPVLMAFE